VEATTGAMPSGVNWLAGLDLRGPDAAVQVVDRALAAARAARATDLHLQPTKQSCELRWRVDGVLHPVASLPAELAPRLTARLKVLSGLLGYRTDIPQEGRLKTGTAEGETRVSTFPSLFGEKVVVRLAIGSGPYQRLNELGLPDELRGRFTQRLEQTSGLLLVTGPAGSGKSTTIYACLREIADKSGGSRNLVTVEDPVEAVIDGVTQSQIHPAQGFTLASGLKALLRQDPDVILVGEIRDKETAEGAFQAALTGHLVLSTFHAGSAAQAVSRLCDMEIEPYILRSTLAAVTSQRLIRRLGEDGQSLGRFPIMEWLDPGENDVGKTILARASSTEIEQRAQAAGMRTLREWAELAVQEGRTTPAEVYRVLGGLMVR
jgi:general secretion pathway protein E